MHSLFSRLMEENDIEWVRELHNDPSTIRQLTDIDHVSQEQQKEWYKSMSLSKVSRRYIVCISDGMVCEKIGVFRIDNIDHKNKSVMFGLDIHPDYRGKGYAAECYNQFLNLYFQQYNMNRIYLKVLESNAIGRHVYEKVGFKEEGRERKAIYRNSKYEDYVCMSILRTEYEQY